MSVTWDNKALKVTPIPADEVLIIDTEDSRNQKRSTLGSFGLALWSRNAGSGFLFPAILTDFTGFGTNTPLAKVNILSTTEQLRLSRNIADFVSFTTVAGEGFNLTTAIYDNVSFSVASQETSPSVVRFNLDGTRMFILGTGATVFQYDLSTPYDVSTAVFNSITFDASGQASSTLGMTFNATGTRMYIVAISTSRVFQYDLSTAFDLSTVVYNSVTFSVSGQALIASGIAFNNDGTRMYITEITSNDIFQYDLSTGFDVSTAVFNSISFNVGAQGAARDVGFNLDGSIMFTIEDINDNVRQYSLSTNFDLSTASFDNISFPTGGQDGGPRSFAFSADGTKMFILGANNDTVFQYSTSTLGTLNIGGPSIANVNIFGTIKVSSPEADVTPITTTESTGTNPGVTNTFVGNRDPNGVVIAAGGAQYLRDSAATSASYENKELVNGTNWFRRNVYPSKDFEINTQAEYDALFTGGVMTITTGTTIFINLQVSGTGIFVLSGGADLTISGRNISDAGITYSGTATLFNGVGTLQIFDAVDIISSSTGTMISIFGTVLLENITVIGWTLLGSLFFGVFLLRFIDFVNIIDGFTINNAVIVFCFSVSLTGIPFTGTFYTFNSTSVTGTIGQFDSGVFLSVASTGTIFDFGLTNTKIIPITVDNQQVGIGNIFKKSTVPNVTINSIGDISPLTGTLTAMAPNVSGGTTISSTITYFEDEELTISGTTSYNGTFFIFNVVAGVSFDISAPFVANDATGSSDSVRLALALPPASGVTAGNTLKIIDTNFYNGFVTALDETLDVVTVNGTFVSTNTGSIEINVGLDQTDARISASINFGTDDSVNIACSHVNDNSTANGAIVNNVFTDMVFGTTGSALVASTTMERWRLIDEINGIFEYIGLDIFDGSITFDFTVSSVGGTADFRFKWQHDIGAGFVDLPDAVESLVAVASSAQSVTKTFPLKVNNGDLIKPQITRNSGTSAITTRYATVYAVG